VNVQNSVGEREKQIILKNQPPPIEVHLKNEEPDLMTVIATTVFLHTTATRSTTTVTTITAGTASTAVVTSIKRLSNSFLLLCCHRYPCLSQKFPCYTWLSTVFISCFTRRIVLLKLSSCYLIFPVLMLTTDQNILQGSIWRLRECKKFCR